MMLKRVYEVAKIADTPIIQRFGVPGIQVSFGSLLGEAVWNDISIAVRSAGVLN